MAGGENIVEFLLYPVELGLKTVQLALSMLLVPVVDFFIELLIDRSTQYRLSAADTSGS
ncbi:MAG: hypothetical protein KAV87_47710 [Desulfobacteraceae bacterium]|nr:hypothetical protein [Desulfobacteraceae bacterium]